jgi:hypothetical protein
MWLAGVTAAVSLGAFSSLAQNNNGGNGGNGGGGRGNRPDFRNMSPEERQNWFTDRQKEQLEITDDAEWKVIQPLVQKVNEARMATMGGMMRGFGFGGRRGGDNGGNQDRQNRGGMFGQQQSAEQQALEKAVDAKASNSDLKSALAKYQDARKAKQAELEKAQADLRKVLSVRQEALATLNGIL